MIDWLQFKSNGDKIWIQFPKFLYLPLDLGQQGCSGSNTPSTCRSPSQWSIQLKCTILAVFIPHIHPTKYTTKISSLPQPLASKWNLKKLKKNVKPHTRNIEIGATRKEHPSNDKKESSLMKLDIFVEQMFRNCNNFSGSVNCSWFFWLCPTLPPNMIAIILIMDTGQPYQARWDLSTTEWFAAVTKAKSSTYFHTRP